MTDNVTKVILEIIKLVGSIATIVFPFLLVHLTNRQNKKMVANQAELKASQDAAAAEVKEYRKEVDGHMHTLLEKTEQLATAKEQVVSAKEQVRNLEVTIAAIPPAQPAPLTPPPSPAVSLSGGGADLNLKIKSGEINVTTDHEKKTPPKKK